MTTNHSPTQCCKNRRIYKLKQKPLVFNQILYVYKKNIKTFFFKSCCGPENAMKRFGDKDKVAADECYAQVAEKFATVAGKLNYVQN